METSDFTQSSIASKVSETFGGSRYLTFSWEIKSLTIQLSKRTNYRESYRNLTYVNRNEM